MMIGKRKMIKEKAIIKFKSKSLISHMRGGNNKNAGDDLFSEKYNVIICM